MCYETEFTQETINKIEGGILKEVSIGFAEETDLFDMR